jgi:ABC transporter substrate binding protein
LQYRVNVRRRCRYDDVQSYAAFNAPIGKIQESVRSKDLNLMLCDLARGYAGLVASLNRPGGNATGINILFTALIPKRIELLHAMVPQAATIGLLLNPKQPDGGGEEAARRLGLETVLGSCRDGGRTRRRLCVLQGTQGWRRARWY